MARFVRTSWPPSTTILVGNAVSGVPPKCDRCSAESNSRNGTETVPYRRRAGAPRWSRRRVSLGKAGLAGDAADLALASIRALGLIDDLAARDGHDHFRLGDFRSLSFGQNV